MKSYSTKPIISDGIQINLNSFKNCYSTIFLICLAILQNPIYSTEDNLSSNDVKLAISLFKNGKFDKAREVSSRIIKNQKSIPKKLLSISILTEKDPVIMAKYLSMYYKNEKKFDEELSKSVLFFLERCLVSEKFEFGLKWGYLFKKEALHYPQYPKGLYFYSCILKESGRIKESIFVSSLALSHSTSNSLNEKIKLLRIHNLNKNQSKKEADEFIEKYPDSEFVPHIQSLFTADHQDTTGEYVMR